MEVLALKCQQLVFSGEPTDSRGDKVDLYANYCLFVLTCLEATRRTGAKHLSCYCFIGSQGVGFAQKYGKLN